MVVVVVVVDVVDVVGEAALVVAGVEVPVMTGVPVSMYLVLGSRMSVQPMAGMDRTSSQGRIVWTPHVGSHRSARWARVDGGECSIGESRFRCIKENPCEVRAVTRTAS
jgi:hypothetical protein